MCGRDACHHVEPGAIERLGVFERMGEARPELRLPTGQAGDTSLTRVPIARRRIEEHLTRACVAKPRGQHSGLMGIREQVLHSLEAVGGAATKRFSKSCSP